MPVPLYLSQYADYAPPSWTLIIAAGMTLIVAVLSSLLLVRKRSNRKSLPPEGPKFSDFIQSLRNHKIAQYQTEWHSHYGSVCLIKSPFPLLIRS